MRQEQEILPGLYFHRQLWLFWELGTMESVFAGATWIHVKKEMCFSLRKL